MKFLLMVFILTFSSVSLAADSVDPKCGEEATNNGGREAGKAVAVKTADQTTESSKAANTVD